MKEIKGKKYWQIAFVSVSILIILLGLELCTTQKGKNCNIYRLDFDFLVLSSDLLGDETPMLSVYKDTIRLENRLFFSFNPSFRITGVKDSADKEAYCLFLATDSITITGIYFSLVCEGDSQNITSSVSKLKGDEVHSLSPYSIGNQIFHIDHYSLEDYINLYNDYVTGGGDSYTDIFENAIYNFIFPANIKKNRDYELILRVEFNGRSALVRKKSYYLEQ